VMSETLISLRDTDSPARAATLFRQHGFRHLPLLDATGGFLGLIPQTALLEPLPDLDLAALADPSPRSLPPEAPLVQIVSLLAQGAQTCIPILNAGRLAGLVTRSDLLAALIHTTASRKDPA
jgi:CBS domain-containing membrane protein